MDLLSKQYKSEHKTETEMSRKKTSAHQFSTFKAEHSSVTFLMIEHSEYLFNTVALAKQIAFVTYFDFTNITLEGNEVSRLSPTEFKA